MRCFAVLEQVPPARGRQSDVDLLPTCVDERHIFADEKSTILCQIWNQTCSERHADQGWLAADRR
jgi:hypothetical protein